MMQEHDLYQALLAGKAKRAALGESELYARGKHAHGIFAEVLGGKTPETVKANPLLAPLLDRLAQEADVFSRSEINILPFSLYKLFDTTGKRLAYEEHYFRRRRRLTALALASWLWEKPEHIAALENTIWAVCDEYSWCLPAHMDGKSLCGQDQRRRLDLFACETGFALAECSAMLSALLDPAVLNRAREEIFYRVIESYTGQSEPQNWELLDNNWCAVCAGSVASAALYLVEDDHFLADTLRRLAPAFERFIAGFSADGACLEGLSYWTYGLGFYVSFADLLFHRSAGAIDLLGETKFEAIARFQQYCYFPGGAALWFSDASEDGKWRPGLSSYLAGRVPGVEVPVPRSLRQAGGAGLASYRDFIDHCGRFCLALRDLLWTGDTLQAPVEKNRVTLMPGAQWLLCSGAGETGFAAKGGHNGEPHNHNDTGSFIFYKKGLMFLLDTGAGEYTKEYFSEGRYSIFCNQSEGHNLPLIGGKGQKPGKEFAAAGCQMAQDGTMSLDLAAAYGIAGLERLLRRFHFDSESGVLTLQDGFTFSGKAMPVIERFILPAEPRLLAGGCSLNLNGAVCSIACSENIMPRLNAVTYRNHQGEDERVFTLDFVFEKPGNFSVEFVIR
jgi:hypothetical protein